MAKGQAGLGGEWGAGRVGDVRLLTRASGCFGSHKIGEDQYMNSSQLFGGQVGGQ